MGDYGYRESSSPHINLVWWADIDEDASYFDVANEFWGLAFGVLADGTATATLIGPCLEARELLMRRGERSWGVELAPHVRVRRLGKVELLGEMQPLECEGGWFVLAGVRLQVPDTEGLDGLVEVLLQQGILAVDTAVAAALAGESVHWSERSVHRRVVRAAGLGRNKIEQLQRVRVAHALLRDGHSLTEASQMAGFADQAHMTRAFTAFSGTSPAKILTSESSPFDSRPWHPTS